MADCKDVIAEAMAKGDPRLKQIVSEFVDRVRAFKNPETGEYLKGFSEKVRALKDDIYKARMERAINTRKNVKFKAHMKAYKNPVKGLFEYVENVGTTRQTIEGRLVGYMERSFERLGLLDIAKSGELDDQITKYLWDKSNGEDVSWATDHVKAYGELLYKFELLTQAEQKRVGVLVRKAKNRPMALYHDAEKIIANKEAWKQRLLSTFKRVDGKPLDDEYLEHLFNDIKNGRYELEDANHAADSVITTVKKGMKETTKQLRSRSLVADGPEQWAAYNKDYGSGSLYQNAIATAKKQARSLALIDHFGPDTEGGFEGLKQRFMLENKDNKKVEKFLDREGDFLGIQLGKKNLDNVFKEVQGLTSMPARDWKAKTGVIARAWQNITKLGGVALSTFTDVPFVAAMASKATGRNFILSHFDMVKNFTQGFVGPTARKDFLRRIGMLTDDSIGYDYANMGVDSFSATNMDSWIKKVRDAERRFFKMNLLSAQTESGIYAIAKQLGHELALQSKNAFNTLNPWLRSAMDRAGITEKEWSVLKHAVEDINGNGFVTIEGIERLTKEQLKDLVGGGKNFDLRAEKARMELSTKVANFYNHWSRLGMRVPNEFVKSIMKGGKGQDDLFGQVMRFFFQFKSFALMTTEGLKELYGSSSGIKASRLTQLGFVPATMGAALISYAAKQLAKQTNKAILEGNLDAYDMSALMPTTQDEWIEFADQTGLGGIYANMGSGFFKKWDDNLNIGGAGPVISDIVHAGQGIGKIGEGGTEFPKVDRAERGEDILTRLAVNQLPGRNLFYTKFAYDSLLDTMMSMSNERYAEQKARQKAKEIMRRTYGSN